MTHKLHGNVVTTTDEIQVIVTRTHDHFSVYLGQLVVLRDQKLSAIPLEIAKAAYLQADCLS